MPPIDVLARTSRQAGKWLAISFICLGCLPATIGQVSPAMGAAREFSCSTTIDEEGRAIQPPDNCLAVQAAITNPAIVPVVGCEDFVYAEDSQALLNAVPEDPLGLDPEGNGIACDPPPPIDPAALDALMANTDPVDFEAIRQEAQGIVGFVIGPQPADPLVAWQRGFGASPNVWDMVNADDADRYCNAIGYAVPEGWDSIGGPQPTASQRARYWTCHRVVDANEVSCTEPFSYTHPTDGTLSVPDGYWLIVCGIYPMGGQYLGVVVDPKDFALVDAAGQRFGYRPFPIQAPNVGYGPVYREFLLPGAVTSGSLTFMGRWADLDPAVDYPLRLEWKPSEAIVPRDLLTNNFQQTVPVDVTLTTIILEPVEPEIIDWSEDPVTWRPAAADS